jgi:hypothetical protein
MKLNLVIGTGAFALLAWGLASQFSTGAEIRRRAEMQAFMRQKLAWSQGVLEGLSLEKFDLVSKNAIRMRDMTKSNFWYTIRQPDYMARTTNYQKSVDALYLAAVDKNLEAATEAYVAVTKNCIDCHRLVRTAQHKVLSPEKK